MNTNAVKEQIGNLKSADIAAYKAHQNSHFVLDFVRSEVLKRAFKADPELNKEVSIMMSMTVASYVIPSLALLSKEGQYPALFTRSKIDLNNGEIKFTYLINANGLSNEYRTKLNEALGINIPVAEEFV